MPQEQTKRETGGNAAGILTALLLFICILSVAYYTYLKSVNPSMTPKDLLPLLAGSQVSEAKEAQVQFAFEFDSKEKSQFTVYDDCIAKCSTGGIWLLDKKGATVWTESISLNNPIIKTNGAQLLVADIGAGGIFVAEGKTIRWREKLDASILNADISEDGYVTVIVASKRYNNEIRVYDRYGVELLRKFIANDFAVNAGISPNEKTLVVSGISTGSYGAYSEYKFYDFNGNEPVAQTFEASGELLPLFWFNGDGSLFAAGDKAVACVDKAGRIIWEKQFTAVSGACPAGDKRLAVTEESSKGVQLVLLDSKGLELASGRLAFKPGLMAAVKGAVAVLANDTVYFYNDKCININKYSSASQIRQIIFFNRHLAAIITNDTVTIVSIN
jgi:hypothetical protein